MIYIDLPADLNLEDDQGHNVARLADAVTPDAVTPVAELADGLADGDRGQAELAGWPRAAPTAGQAHPRRS